MTLDVRRRDIRDTSLYREAEALYRAICQPGTGLICDAGEPSTNGTSALFSGTLVEVVDGRPPTRICEIDLATGSTRVLTFGPRNDCSPRYAPDGRHIAFLSDRDKEGDYQLYLLELESGAARAAPRVTGWVEYLRWSPNGRRILLGVAGHGADIAGGQGAIRSSEIPQGLPAWMPTVECGDESFRWRSAWIYDIKTHQVREVALSGQNVWEAVWCGNDTLAAVLSPGPTEGLWYKAGIHLIDLRDDHTGELYRPHDQVGLLAACPSGQHLAFVEAVCSDRGIIAGDLRIADLGSRTIRPIGTSNIDITFCEWRSENRLLMAGHRGFEAAIGLYDVLEDTFTEVWASCELTAGGRNYISLSGLGSSGDCVLVTESIRRAPQMALIRSGQHHLVRSFDVGYGEIAEAGIGAAEALTWRATDGLEIQGWLLLPKNGKAPFPTVLNVHGGPVGLWRPNWLGRTGLHVLLLLRHGYAVFLPNPRGSVGRGQAFARKVKGDVNGADAHDLLSGIDRLVTRGVADPTRLGVMGGSYGGNMTCWLITQDSRFAAAVALAPHTNQMTEHLLSNIPAFVSSFLEDHYTNAGGKYFERSPVMYAYKARTPTLNVCGALDRCTPPEEAMQFHSALLENGVRSVLVRYPEEGHGIRKPHAALDYAARVVAWFEEHMAKR